MYEIVALAQQSINCEHLQHRLLGFVLMKIEHWYERLKRRVCLFFKVVSSSKFLIIPCKWSIMNVVLSNFQIKIVALSVLLALSPTVALSNNTHYMDGKDHKIGDFSTTEAFYVQKKHQG